METREETIDLRELLGILKKRFWMIFLITLIATIASGVISFYFLTPQYEAKTELLVNKENPEQGGVITQQQIDANLRLIETYSLIIQSQRIIKPVAEKVNMKGQEKDLTSKVNVSTVKNSQVISVTVTDENQKKAVEIANTIATTFQEEIIEIMKVDNVQILTEAEYDATMAPVKPNKMLNIAIAFVVGLMASVGLAFLIEYMDKTIKTEQDVTRKLGLPVLGSITAIKERDIKREPLSTRRPLREVAASREDLQ